MNHLRDPTKRNGHRARCAPGQLHLPSGPPRSARPCGLAVATLLVFRLHPHGVHQPGPEHPLAGLLGADPDTWHAGRATYDPRRLRLRGLIERIPRTNRYPVTDAGLHHALFLTRVHDRLIRTGTAHHADPDPPTHRRWQPPTLRSTTSPARPDSERDPAQPETAHDQQLDRS